MPVARNFRGRDVNKIEKTKTELCELVINECANILGAKSSRRFES